MRPYPEEVLRSIQSGIVAHFAPEVQSTYGKAQFAFSVMLFTIALRDYDSAVPDLLEANRTLRDLLVGDSQIDVADAFQLDHGCLRDLSVGGAKVMLVSSPPQGAALRAPARLMATITT